MSSKHKKVLLLTEMEQGIEPIIQQVTNIQQENMLTIHSYDSVIVHPFWRYNEIYYYCYL